MFYYTQLLIYNKFSKQQVVKMDISVVINKTNHKEYDSKSKQDLQ